MNRISAIGLLFVLVGCAYKMNNPTVKYKITDEELSSISVRMMFSDSVDTTHLPNLRWLNSIRFLKLDHPKRIFTFGEFFNLTKSEYYISQEIYNDSSKIIAQNGFIAKTKMQQFRFYFSECLDTLRYRRARYYVVLKLNNKRVAEDWFEIKKDSLNTKM